LGQGRLDAAAHRQTRLDPLVEAAVRAYPDDAYLLSMAGYQKKNAYMIKHWTEIQARQSPPDPLLAEAEARFWQALQVRPDDPGALNGLGSILWLRGDLDAAEFFVQRALERAQEEGISYPYAEADLRNIRREQQRRNLK
jgi:Flp pilus assembly protein TadD